MGSHNGLNGTPLEPSLFWLDNTFNMMFLLSLIGNLKPKSDETAQKSEKHVS
jgi:hypothetical protein